MCLLLTMENLDVVIISLLVYHTNEVVMNRANL